MQDAGRDNSAETCKEDNSGTLGAELASRMLAVV